MAHEACHAFLHPDPNGALEPSFQSTSDHSELENPLRDFQATLNPAKGFQSGVMISVQPDTP
ncbi:MAG: hypothetical protein ACRD4Y_00230, partial [Candidatus Acidiferrales bacterium]